VHNVPPKIDDVGEELPDDEAAWREATVYAGEVLKDAMAEYVPARNGR
jgi:hypothetical protein